MSEPEKPLHVRVAEALGCKVTSDCCGCGYGTSEERPGIGYRHGCFGGPEDDSDPSIASYDTDWSATGPLIQRYQICLEPAPANATKRNRSDTWIPDDLWTWYRADWCSDEAQMNAYGATPLLAVCNLILALKEVDKLR